MGLTAFDEYTVLHLISGGIAKMLGVSLPLWIFLHTVFEVLENTNKGILTLRKIYFWPGGKPYADALRNSVTDSVAAILGWLIVNRIE